MEPTATPPIQPGPAPNPPDPSQDTPPTPMPQMPQPMAQQTVPVQPAYQNPSGPAAPPPGHDHKRLTIIVVAAVIIIVGGLLAYLLLFAKKDNTPTDTSGVTSIVNPNVQVESRDTKRKTDINALQGQIEAYGAQNGYYPTLANINDPTWRAANMKGLDSTALQDPKGSTEKLLAAPASDAYSYAATPADCDNSSTDKDCTGYTLSANLEAGGSYVKENLN